jgi:hypothetical protein
VNAAAAASLRSRYPLYRRGCVFGRLGMEINLQTASPSTETLAEFEPRNELRVSGVELRQPTVDLPGPGLFYTLLGLIVEAVNQGASQSSSSFRRKLEGLLENLGSVTLHTDNIHRMAAQPLSVRSWP